MTKKGVEWLKQNSILPISQKYVDSYKKVLVNCLKVQKQKVLVLGDYGYEGKRISPIISTSYYLAAKELGLDVEMVLEKAKTKGEAAEAEVVAALDSLDNGNVIITNMSNGIGSIKSLSKSFRAFAKSRDHRFISTSSLGLDSSYLKHFISCTDIDYAELQAKAKMIKDALDNGNEIHCTTEAGTDIYYDIKGKEARSADGDYGADGKGGNLPAGEVYVPCRGKHVNGKVVIDGSSRNRFKTAVVKEPITMEIKDGVITSIEGGEEAQLLEASLAWAEKKAKYPWGIRRIGEFGIGINPNAQLIGSTVLDEKVIGTAHVAMGSNYWFGGSIYAIIHFDQVFKNPKFFIDGKELIV